MDPAVRTLANAMRKTRNLPQMNRLDQPKRCIMGPAKHSDKLQGILLDLHTNPQFIAAMRDYNVSAYMPPPPSAWYWRLLGYA